MRITPFLRRRDIRERGQVADSQDDGRSRVSSGFPMTPLLSSHFDAQREESKERPGTGIQSTSSERSISSDRSSGNITKPSPRPPRRPRYLALWAFETLSLLFSFVCIVTAITFLYAIDGKPYNSWHMVHVDITPNTVLSTLITMCKATFLLPIAAAISQLKWGFFQRRARRISLIQTFDEASRGPLGAVKLLWYVKHHAGLAVLGAFLTVLALAAEPFTNQILTFPTLSTNATNATASIGTAYSFVISDMEMGFADSFTPQKMLGAVGRALYAPDSHVSYSCLSGSCIWPKFESLGICNACVDTSDRIGIQCEACPSEEMANSGCHCNYIAPGGINTTLAYYFDPYAKSNTSVVPAKLMITSVKPRLRGNKNATKLIVPMGPDGDFVEFSALQFKTQYFLQPQRHEQNVKGQQQEVPLFKIRPKGYSCVLSWCMNVFEQTHFDNGALSDITTSTKRLRLAYDHCNVTGVMATCPAYVADKIAPSAKGLSGSAASLANQTVFWIGERASFDTMNGLLQTLQTEPNVDTAMQMAFESNNNGNISQTLDDIGASITRLIREGPQSTPVIGTATYPRTFVQVRWPWLIYVASIFTLSAVFFLTSTISSWINDSPAWKSSSLALLFNALDDWPHDYFDMRSTTTMEKSAHTMCVRLDGKAETGRLSFVKAKEDS